LAKNGWLSTSTPAATTQGLLTRSVQAGTPSSSPSLAGTSAPSLERRRISVSTAEPFATSAHLHQAIRLALGSAELGGLRHALSEVREVVDADPYG
jgi:hypothetical protein